MANFEFKPFDKILVRNCIMGHKAYWIPALYGFKSEDMKHYLTSAGWQEECIPYEGNEEYLGTTKDYVDIISMFKVGDWLVENEPNNYARFVQILEIVDIQGKKRYRISRDIHNDEDIAECRFVEKYYHKFDIKDAKDGDVLHASSFSSDCIFIFDRLDKWEFDEPNGERTVATGHCCLTLSADNMEFGIQGPDCIKVDTVKPATKEQRDLLFQKMKEAGYEWDAEKKELKKIEQKPTEWSEIEPIIQHLDNLGNTAMADILRSFEPQPKQKWKPSKNQIMALRWILNNIPYCTHKEEISGLLEQLEQL